MLALISGILPSQVSGLKSQVQIPRPAISAMGEREGWTAVHVSGLKSHV